MACLRMRTNTSLFHQISTFKDKPTCFQIHISSLTSSKTYYYSRSIATSSSSSSSVTQVGEHPVNKASLFSGLEDLIMGYFFGKNKATQVAHAVWKKVVKKGDTVIDATCGNGHDTLALLHMVADTAAAFKRGRVYAMDIQKVALENTTCLLNQHVTPQEKELVELFGMCHSQMEDIVPENDSIRLVAFNLGYLPGGNRRIIPKPDTTRLALEAAGRVLVAGGLISILVYVGHAGGREEYETVQGFASELASEAWNCCKLEMINRPLAPVLFLLFKIK